MFIYYFFAPQKYTLSRGIHFKNRLKKSNLRQAKRCRFRVLRAFREKKNISEK